MKTLYWCLVSAALFQLVSNAFTALNGRHLVISAQSSPVHAVVIRNSSGHILKIDGVSGDAIAILSQHFNFTYSHLQVNDSSLNQVNDLLPGLGFYLRNDKSDVVVGTVVMSTVRLANTDFAEGYTYTTVAVLIPMPQATANTAALIKPFQASVWIAFLIFIPIIAIALYFSARPMPWHSLSFNWKKGILCPTVSLTGRRVIFEVIRTLLGQADKFPGPPRGAVYLVLGSWCLTAFVLVSAYNSVLISYILGSNAQPLVSSVMDIASRPDVRVSINKGNEIDLVLSAAKDGMYKALGDKLRSDPKSRCPKRPGCVELVKTERYTYIQSMHVALTAIDDDFKATNQCHLALAKKFDPTPGSLAWALPKKSPYTKVFTKGFMELHQAGLIDYFVRRELLKNKNVNFCLNEADKRQKSKIFDKQTKITLKNFAGAFSVLISGCILSFLCFLGENLFPILIKFVTEQLNRRNGFTNENCP